MLIPLCQDNVFFFSVFFLTPSPLWNWWYSTHYITCLKEFVSLQRIQCRNKDPLNGRKGIYLKFIYCLVTWSRESNHVSLQGANHQIKLHALRLRSILMLHFLFDLMICIWLLNLIRPFGSSYCYDNI